MKASPFRYRRPDSVAQVLTWLQEDPDGSKILAGGQSLVPLLNLRLARPEALIDINYLLELDRIIEDSGSLLLGALVRHRELERSAVVARRVPMLSEAARHIGHIAIRNRGTLGGTVCHADPASEIPLIGSVLGATVYLESGERGRRAVPAADFAVGFFSTIAEPDEMLTWIRMPALRAGEGWGFTEFTRRHGDFAMAGAVATLQLKSSGEVASARAGVFGVGDKPTVLGTADLTGRRPTDQTFSDWAASAMRSLRPTQDAAYRRRLAVVAVTRALHKAVERCIGSEAVA